MRKLSCLALIPLLSASVLFSCGSNLPPNEDYDYDGLINKIDPSPKNNEYKVRLNLDTDKQSKDIATKVDYREFIKEGYNKDLALFSSIIINAVDGAEPTFVKNTYKPSLKEKLPIFGQIGGQDIKYIETSPTNFDPYDAAGIYLAHHTFINEDKNKYQLFFVTIDAYIKSSEQWISDFDIGAWDNNNNKITDGYKEFWNTDNHPDWLDHQMHKGFNVTANRSKAIIDDYIKEYKNNDAHQIIIISGHSRSAAVSDIIAKKYIDDNVDVRAYCFNPPMVTKEKITPAENEKYKNIFLFTNTNDVISRVPCPNYWDFNCYGNEYKIDVSKEGKSLFEDYFGKIYTSPNEAFLNVLELMLADLSCLVEPTDPSIDYTDSNNIYEKWHYSDSLGAYDYYDFDNQESADEFEAYINAHCASSIELTKNNLHYSWKNKGALLLNFLVDYFTEEEGTIEHYSILLVRLIEETISELILEGGIDIADILQPKRIIERIENAHKNEIACILAMCENKKH